jgi:hypothetical protein
MARSISTALAVAALAVLAGCGGSTTKTVTQVQNTPTQTGTTQTTGTIPPIKIPSSTNGATPSSGGTLSDAVAKVNSLGFNVDDPNDYESSHTLRVLIGTRKDSGDGYAKQAFFFVGGRYIGTDTSDISRGIRVEDQQDTTITLGYALYRRNDPLCCPSGGDGRVRYHWDGSHLVPLDPIPSSSSSASVSR